MANSISIPLRHLAMSLFLLSATLLPAQTTLFVAPNGNDKSKGTQKSPLQTLHRAKQLASQATGDITIYLMEGTYYLDSTLVWQADEVQPGSRITVKPYGHEAVRISGAKPLKVKWTPYQGDILQTKVSDAPKVFDQLVVDGLLQRMARYPNYDSTAVRFGGVAADAISPERVARWSNPEGGYLHASHRRDWGSMHFRIKGKKEDGKLDLEGGWQNNRLDGISANDRMVENIFEELDAPGEWFYNSDNQTLYFYPQHGMSVPSVVEVPQLAHLVELRGSAENPITNIRFENITFEHTARTFMQPYEKLLRSDWGVYRGGAFLIEGAENCAISDCDFINLGGNGVFFSNYNRHNTVAGCHFTNLGASAVLFVGDPNAVRSPLFDYFASQPFEEIDRTVGPKSNNYPTFCTVSDNLMHHIGTVEKQVAGVQLSMCSHITVAHNSIYDVPRAGINISEGTWGGHILEYNDVFDTVKETGDHGSFNSWGRDRFWFANAANMYRYANQEPTLPLADARYTVVIRNNRFRCDRGWDIDLDDGSSNYHIYNNLCLNGGIKLREGFDRVVENNILVNSTFHPHVWFDNSRDVFMRNIVMRPYRPIEVNDWGTMVNHNVFLDSLTYQTAIGCGVDTLSVVTHIDFVNPSIGDYTVPDSSLVKLSGFKNFAMDCFGVTSARLKQMAATPHFPQVIKMEVSAADKLVAWQGLTLKSLTTLGERSATGMDSERGVYVMDVEYNSPVRDYIKSNDVILGLGGYEVNDIHQFEAAWEAVKAATDVKEIEVIYFRNQHEQQLALPTTILKK